MARKYFNFKTQKLYESVGTEYHVEVVATSVEDEAAAEEIKEQIINGVDTCFSEEECANMVLNVIESLQDDYYFDIKRHLDVDSDPEVDFLHVPGVAVLEIRIVSSEDAEADGGESLALESVSERFAKFRKLYESDDEDKSDDEEKSDDSSDDDNKDSDSEGDEGDGDGDDSKDDDDSDDDEESELKAIKLTVAKEDAEKCKEELIDAGVAEDDIEIEEGEDDDENSTIIVDVNSVMELKDYLDKKGIDLEEKIGGELVDDDEDSDDEGKGDDEGEGDEDKDKEGDDAETFDYENIGDLFGAEDE